MRVWLHTQRPKPSTEGAPDPEALRVTTVIAQQSRMVLPSVNNHVYYMHFATRGVAIFEFL